MRRDLIFPFDDKQTITDKVNTIEKIIGKNHVCLFDLNCEIPELVIRCNKKKWNKIKRKIGFVKIYW